MLKFSREKHQNSAFLRKPDLGKFNGVELLFFWAKKLKSSILKGHLEGFTPFPLMLGVAVKARSHLAIARLRDILSSPNARAGMRLFPKQCERADLVLRTRRVFTQRN